MTKTSARPTGTAPDPTMEAGRLVSKILDRSFTVADRSRLKALGCVWCPTCYAYQMRRHGCWPGGEATS
jgi:hypothetical protein